MNIIKFMLKRYEHEKVYMYKLRARLVVNYQSCFFLGAVYTSDNYLVRCVLIYSNSFMPSKKSIAKF